MACLFLMFHGFYAAFFARTFDHVLAELLRFSHEAATDNFLLRLPAPDRFPELIPPTGLRAEINLRLINLHVVEERPVRGGRPAPDAEKESAIHG